MFEMQGFPGNVNATVVYTLTDDGELKVDFNATSDAATPINMAQHSYFNLNGATSGSTALDNLVTINAYARTSASPSPDTESTSLALDNGV